MIGGTGVLQGLKVLEMGGIGPAPFAGMLLSDMGADVIRIDRPGGRTSLTVDDSHNLMLRGRRSIVLDLRLPAAVDAVLRLVSSSDALIEGFRPGVLERLHLGPTACTDRNPKLVYARATGWGQTGPLAQTAGHDINYLAITGILNAIGYPDRPPVIPLNLLGDFAGGGLTLAFGIVCAVLEAERSGQGQIVDAAMIDGLAILATAIHSLRASGLWSDRRGTNLMDGGAPFYGVYETADGGFVAVGAVEPKSYRALLETLGLESSHLPDQMDRASWPTTKTTFASKFKNMSRDEWIARFEGKDACVSPVLSFEELEANAHHRDRGAYIVAGGLFQPTPTPRFSRTPGAIRPIPSHLGADTIDVLEELGYSAAEIDDLVPSSR